jgi:hypothetical protein
MSFWALAQVAGLELRPCVVNLKVCIQAHYLYEILKFSHIFLFYR